MAITKNGGSNILNRQYEPICLELARALETIGMYQRRMSPIEFSGSNKEELLPMQESLKRAIQNFREIDTAEELKEAIDILDEASGLILGAFDTIFNSSTWNFQEAFVDVMRARRRTCRAQEKLYSIRSVFPLLNRIFLEPEVYDRAETPDPKPPEGALVGLNHFGLDDDDYARGAVSIYAPEDYTPGKKWPVVVALHGGAGHGRDFIWTWVREAKSRGFILVSPTSKGQTWSLFEPQVDGTALNSSLEYLGKYYNFDMDKILLTGISDGATFALQWLLEPDCPFNAFAPIAGVFAANNPANAKGKRIYQIHGALDWMFNVQRARHAYDLLSRAGADITLNVIDDLAHTYPPEENKNILKWFDSELALPGQ